MQLIEAFIKIVLGAVTGLFVILFGIALPVGGLYWMWIAIQIGSFWMFVLGIIPPAWPITSTVGIYSLLFGAPHWVFTWFG